MVNYSFLQPNDRTWLYNIYFMLIISGLYKHKNIHQIMFEITPVIFWFILCLWGISKVKVKMQKQKIMTNHIRPYKKDDFEEVLNILRKNTPEYFSPDEEKDLIFYLNHEIEDYFIVESDGQIAGAGGINYSKDKAQGHFSWAMVDPDFQGKGIGKLILSHRLQILTGNPDIQEIFVRTSQLVYQFYEKQGFVLTDIVKDYWAPGFDLYDMRYVR